MYVIPYPFQCVMVYDDSDDYTFIHEDRFEDFVQQNSRPDVLQRRTIRQHLRALSGQLVHLEFDRWETHRVEDGTETYTDSEGHRRTRTRYSSVKVHMFYHNGTLRVAANSNLTMAPGFKVSISYSDGHGTCTAPHTGELKHIKGCT